MPTTTTIFGPGTTSGSGGSLPAEVRQAYDANLLKAAEPRLIHAQFCTDHPIPKNQGTTSNMRRWELVTPNTTALTEGVTPPSNAATVTNVTVAVSQYGDWLLVTEFAQWTMIDDVLVEFGKRLGQSSGQGIDQLSRDFMSLGTNVLYANSRISRVTVQAGDKFTAVEAKKSVRILQTAYVDPYDDGCYVGIVSPYTQYDVMSISEWLAAKEYSDPQDLYKGELGKLYGIRFVMSPLAKVFAGAGAASADVHGTLVFGPDAFVKSKIAGGNLQNIQHPPGSGGSSDPLNQRATSGYKYTYGGTMGNQNFCVRVEHGVSA